jgi:regulator of protease activity HflC (stomatin/prohibitin superfamily)
MSRSSPTILLGAQLLCAFLTLASCYNPDTPAGHEGYVRRGALVGSAAFHSAQVGPTSTGLGWLLSIENVDYRWATYSEKFQVMSADNLSLTFSAHVVMRPKPGSVKELVEIYGGSDWYKRNLEQPFRNAVYEAVSGYKALDAKDKREEIGGKVRIKLLAFLKGKPFEVQSIVVGTINLPQSVAMAQEQKISKETELERKKFEIDIAKREAEVRVEEAKGIAEAQKIINITLTPNYLQHEAIKAQEKMASSPNHTTVYIPSGTNGIPIVKIVP